MSDLSVDQTVLDQTKSTINAVAATLSRADQVLRNQDTHVVGAYPLVDRIDDLHGALSEVMRLFGEYLGGVSGFIDETGAAFDHADRILADDARWVNR